MKMSILNKNLRNYQKNVIIYSHSLLYKKLKILIIIYIIKKIYLKNADLEEKTN